MKVPYVNLGLQHQAIREELMAEVGHVLDHGQFILGPEVTTFESRFASYSGARYAIGVDNGTSALVLTLRALGIGPGDEVITAPNSFLASASCVALTGARPVFVDVREDYNIDPRLIEDAITPSTKAIIPVHLTGRPADMQAILEIARRHKVYVVEDAAQAVGAIYHGHKVGTFGIAGCFSLHPLKNLNACGDAGVVTTNDPELYEKLVRARNHGLHNRDECEFWSYNCRLDTLQAAILNVKLNYLDDWISERRATAAFYREQLHKIVEVPDEKSDEFAVYHTFVVQADRRDDLRFFLENQGIETKVHYPIPIHFQKAARNLGYHPGDFPVAERQTQRILSLPIYPELTMKQKEAVVRAVRAFYA